VTQVVLDGEALWMNADRPASFQYTVSQIDSEAPREGIVTFLFDLLHLDGEDLLDTPLRDRIARLEAIAASHRIRGVLTADPQVAERVLEQALRAGHEGVVVKDADCAYVGGRRGKAWRKVKPARTYDLVVLGAGWGHGRRQGWLSNLHLGARETTTGEFVMGDKTFKGLTDEMLTWQTAQLLAREVGRRGITVLVECSEAPAHVITDARAVATVRGPSADCSAERLAAQYGAGHDDAPSPAGDTTEADQPQR
jgi:DNA ligase-1